MIGSLMSRMADAEKLSIPQLQKSIQDGIIPAYVGVPLLQDKMQKEKAKAVPQQPTQPPIAQQVMAEAAQHGIDSAPSNLPTQEMAGGGIVAFAGEDGSLVEDDEDDTDYQKQDLAMFQRNLAAMAGDNDEDLDEDEEMPEGIMAVMPRENRGVGINPESKGGIGIKDVLAAKAKENKLPPELLNKIAGIESGYKSTAANPNSTAKGLFQFTDSTWRSMGGKEGEQFNPEKNAELGAKFVRQNAEGLKGALGRNPTYGEVYASHFFGLKGAKDLLNMDPRTPMDQAVSAQVLKANPQLRDKTVGQVMASLNNKMGDGIVALAKGGVVAFTKGGTPEDEQQKQDKEDFMMGAKKLGSSALDVLTLPARGVMGAVNTGVVRPIRATGLNLPYIPEEAFGGSSSSMTPYYDKYVRKQELAKEEANKPIPSKFTQEELQKQQVAENEPNPSDKPSWETDNEEQDIQDKIAAAKAAGRKGEDITSLEDMLNERAKSAKNQKSIDNYMALLQAGLGMMGGTSPYAAANIGQGASKGIAHLADARKSQIAEENALLSGRLGLSRAQLYEQTRKDALARQIANDRATQAYRNNVLGLNIGKAAQTQAHNTNLTNLKARELYDKAGGDVGLRQEFVKQYGKNWETDPRYMQLFKLKRNEAISDYLGDASAIIGGGGAPSASSLLQNG